MSPGDITVLSENVESSGFSSFWRGRLCLADVFALSKRRDFGRLLVVDAIGARSSFNSLVEKNFAQVCCSCGKKIEKFSPEDILEEISSKGIYLWAISSESFRSESVSLNFSIVEIAEMFGSRRVVIGDSLFKISDDFRDSIAQSDKNYICLETFSIPAENQRFLDSTYQLIERFEKGISLFRFFSDSRRVKKICDYESGGLCNECKAFGKGRTDLVSSKRYFELSDVLYSEDEFLALSSSQAYEIIEREFVSESYVREDIYLEDLFKKFSILDFFEMRDISLGTSISTLTVSSRVLLRAVELISLNLENVCWSLEALSLLNGSQACKVIEMFSQDVNSVVVDTEVLRIRKDLPTLLPENSTVIYNGKSDIVERDYQLGGGQDFIEINNCFDSLRSRNVLLDYLGIRTQFFDDLTRFPYFRKIDARLLTSEKDFEFLYFEKLPEWFLSGRVGRYRLEAVLQKNIEELVAVSSGFSFKFNLALELLKVLDCSDLTLVSEVDSRIPNNKIRALNLISDLFQLFFLSDNNSEYAKRLLYLLKDNSISFSEFGFLEERKIFIPYLFTGLEARYSQSFIDLVNFLYRVNVLLISVI